MNKEPIKIIVKNKKASFNYFLSDPIECGIELKGTEVKSIMNHSMSIDDAYVMIKKGEVFLINSHIAEYEKGNIFNHDTKRPRKLLLHKNEIRKYESKLQKEGTTLVPTKVYFSKGKCKVEIALGKGKKLYDKRETIKQRDISREISKAGK